MDVNACEVLLSPLGTHKTQVFWSMRTPKEGGERRRVEHTAKWPATPPGEDAEERRARGNHRRKACKRAIEICQPKKHEAALKQRRKRVKSEPVPEPERTAPADLCPPQVLAVLRATEGLPEYCRADPASQAKFDVALLRAYKATCAPDDKEIMQQLRAEHNVDRCMGAFRLGPLHRQHDEVLELVKRVLAMVDALVGAGDPRPGAAAGVAALAALRRLAE